MSEVTVQTHLSIKLDGSVDSRGEAIIPPDIILPTAEDTTIAPWLAPDHDDEPVCPPVKVQRAFLNRGLEFTSFCLCVPLSGSRGEHHC